MRHHRTPTFLAILSTTFVVAAAAPARADTPAGAVHDDAMPAVHGGLEIVVGVGTTETTGDVGDGMNGEDLVGSAPQLELQIGHRITPNLTLGFYATALGYTDGNVGARDVWGGSAGLEADMHLRPGAALDPWLSVGAGVRAIWIQDGGDSVIVGAELARVQVGLDLRVSPGLAIGPVVGASASLYGAQRTPDQDFAELDDKGINWTFSVGVAGRFNLLGTRR